jgi:hypothetical protein
MLFRIENSDFVVQHRIEEFSNFLQDSAASQSASNIKSRMADSGVSTAVNGTSLSIC